MAQEIERDRERERDGKKEGWAREKDIVRGVVGERERERERGVREEEINGDTHCLRQNDR